MNLCIYLTLEELNRAIELMKRSQMNQSDATLISKFKAISGKHSQYADLDLDEIPF